jgi:hypothetical protein
MVNNNYFIRENITVCCGKCASRSNPSTGVDKTFGLQEVEAPRIFRQSACEGGKTVRVTAHNP